VDAEDAGYDDVDCAEGGVAGEADGLVVPCSLVSMLCWGSCVGEVGGGKEKVVGWVWKVQSGRVWGMGMGECERRKGRVGMEERSQ
jgi:hypothetical protein